jgi:outer membrane protein assembly factor BamA
MRLTPWALFITLFLSASFLPAECVNDHRSNKNAGILITDFTITGTQTISTTDLARITSDMIGSCFDEDSEEMEERVRASFQDRGYFKVEVKSLRFKPRDPLGVPKPVTLEGEVSEGARYKLAEITFVENHAFSSEILRKQFPLKKGDLFERGKVASGLESLRRIYGTRGFLDYTAIPDTEFASGGTVSLKISFQEGPQYHMGKLDIVADKEVAARLGAEWKLAEGDVYDHTYIDQFLETNRDSLPLGFSRANVHTIQNCPDAVVEVRLIVDPAEDTSHAEPKNVLCEDHHDHDVPK